MFTTMLDQMFTIVVCLGRAKLAWCNPDTFWSTHVAVILSNERSARSESMNMHFALLFVSLETSCHCCVLISGWINFVNITCTWYAGTWETAHILHLSYYARSDFMNFQVLAHFVLGAHCIGTISSHFHVFILLDFFITVGPDIYNISLPWPCEARMMYPWHFLIHSPGCDPLQGEVRKVWEQEHALSHRVVSCLALLRGTLG